MLTPIATYESLGAMAAKAHRVANFARINMAVETCMHLALQEPDNADMRAAFNAYNNAFNAAIDAPLNILCV